MRDQVRRLIRPLVFGRIFRKAVLHPGTAVANEHHLTERTGSFRIFRQPHIHTECEQNWHVP